MIDSIYNTGLQLSSAPWWTGAGWPVVWGLVKIVCVVVPLLVAVAYMTLWERKLLGYMQVRQGPNRVGPWGLWQPFADGIKLLTKELIQPTQASQRLFWLGPVLAIMPALAAWVAVPFAPHMAVANIDAGLLLILAITSIEVYGVIIAGWASNSKYAMLGALRSAAQVVSYEICMGFALVGVLVAAGSLNITDIVNAQAGNDGFLEFFFVPLFPLFLVYFISGVAETNRAPFDVAEGESEIVAGFHVEYSGSAFAIFFLAEYANMILVSFLAALLFLGGWLSPFQGWDIPLLSSNGAHWLFLKAGVFAFSFLWFRATFPRYRYDQIMRLGWKVFIPITIVWIFVTAVAAYNHWFTIGA